VTDSGSGVMATSLTTLIGLSASAA